MKHIILHKKMANLLTPNYNDYSFYVIETFKINYKDFSKQRPRIYDSLNIY